MGLPVRFPGGIRALLLTAGCASFGLYLACGPTGPQPVSGPSITGNVRPRFSFVSPAASFSVGQGGSFEIEWTDQDQDSPATIAFALVNTDSNSSPSSVLLVEGVPENDFEAPDALLVSTGFVPRGTYFLRAEIEDDVNPSVEVFATLPAPGTSRIIVTIGEAGATPGNSPPSLVVTLPVFNLAVTLDSSVQIVVQPTALAPDISRPFDVDDNATLRLSLDLDDDPLTGDPANPDPDELIALLDTPRNIPQGDFGQIVFTISVDLARFPLREDGKPYFIRATIDDGNNPPRDAYATGTINVTRAAGGTVDLGLVGGTILGVRWLGFNPGAKLGTAMTAVPDFDADGIADFLMVAQFGTPTGLQPVGEAYLLYGLGNLRFGGNIDVNTIGTNVEGATFIAPLTENGSGSGITNGLTSVGFVPDLSGDGRPELLFGASFVDGVRQHRDDDPGDSTAGDREELVVRIKRGRLEVFRVDAQGEVEAEPEFSNLAYDGVADTFISSSLPSEAFGDETFFVWGGSEPPGGQFTPTEWVLIKFDNLRSAVPDFGLFDFLNVSIESATLNLVVGDRGDDGDLHVLFTDFGDGTTFNNYAIGGGPPVEDVDFAQDSVVSFSEIVTGANSAEVTETVTDFFDGRQDIVGWIIVPTGANSVGSASSDEGGENARPELEIRYTRDVLTGTPLDNCFPDFLPNNTSNSPTPSPGSEDDIVSGTPNFERLGMVALFHSENRDSAGLVDPNRLSRATIPIDLTGQRPVTEEGFAHVRPGLGAVVQASGRTEGARFQSTIYDAVDASDLNQGPIQDEFGQRVSFIEDIGNDQVPEILISAPGNELDVQDLMARFPTLNENEIPHLVARPHKGNIVLFHGQNYDGLREKTPGCSTLPHVLPVPPTGTCNTPTVGRAVEGGQRYDFLVIHGESPEDRLGGATSAGDFNLDGSPDILCGAPYNDGPGGADSGAIYVVYQRQSNVDVEIMLEDANTASRRPPMVRVRGDQSGDRIGWAQERVFDINGDRIDDIAIASPFADAEGVQPSASCSADFNGDGAVSSADAAALNSCATQFRTRDLSSDNSCTFFDYDNDRDVDDDDVSVFECLRDEASASCCPVDNGIIAVVFGGITLDGDRQVSQIATSDLPGIVFYGANAGDRAGHDIASAGDFNRDGFGDLLISAPGVRAEDADARTRVGVVYLIFGGPNLSNQTFSLDDVGTAALPGLVLLSPYPAGAPNEAPPQFVAGLGDLDNDGFDDVGIGNPLADFVDQLLPQQPGTPGGDTSTGRRRDAGEIYLIYGNNIGG